LWAQPVDAPFLTKELRLSILQVASMLLKFFAAENSPLVRLPISSGENYSCKILKQTLMALKPASAVSDCGGLRNFNKEASDVRLKFSV
jgi:hypothetical protein